MNKIVIVGHPASGYRDVEALLLECGMQAPRPSRREGLLPQDITATLCKAHKLAPIDTVTSEEAFAPVQAGAVWHGMALDLMLGNLDQPLWGWADPQTIYALDYWKDLDPKLSFVLVYDEPHRVLAEAARASGEPPTAEGLQRLLDNWLAFNGALLRFHLRHSGRCLLVHAQQTRRAAGSYLQQLQPMLDTPLALEQAETSALGADGSTLLPVVVPLHAKLALAVTTAGVLPQEAANHMDAAAAERYLVDGVLAEQPAALQLYAELQSAANLPLDGKPRASGDCAAAWEALVRQRSFVGGLMVQLHAEYERVNVAWSQVREQLARAGIDHAVQLTQSQQQIRSVREQLAQWMAQAATLEARVNEQTQESELLLTQLHQVQEEMEQQHLHKQDLEREIRQQSEQAVKVQVALAAAKSSSAASDKMVRERTDENALLLTQLHHVQEELERQFLRGQALERQMRQQAETAGNAQTAVAADLRQVQGELQHLQLENTRLKQRIGPPKPPAPSGAADRIKRQLSYRLGARMIQRSRTLRGWLGMPWALVAEARAFRKDCAERAPQKLPPIHSYRDASEAERVKLHLSYRLGSTFLRHGQSPGQWIALPFALRREVKKFRRERKGEAR